MKKLPLNTIVAIALIALSLQAQAAAPEGGGIMNDILTRFQTVAATWAGKISTYASWLFWILALISMVWTFGMMALKKADIGEVLAETIRFFATTSFFYWILINAPSMAVDIINSLRNIAAQATGLGNTLYPSSIVDIGFDVVGKVIDQSSTTSPIDSALGILVGAAILIVLALVAVNMLLLLISGWLLAYGGQFLTGFGGARWTSDIAITYFKTVLGLGMQLFAMILIVGVGQSFIDSIHAQFSDGSVTLKSLIVMLVASIIMLVLTNKVPPMFGGMVGGGSTSGIGSFGGGAALGAAATAAAAAATAGAAVAAGATSAAGGASALKAAFQAASESMANGTGMFAKAGGSESGGSGGADTGSSSSGGSSSGIGNAGGANGSGGQAGKASSTGSSGSSLSQAMGTAARFAGEMGSQLARGAAQGIQAKASSMAEKAGERIAQTAGGRLASEINGTASKARDDASIMKQADATRQAEAVQAAREFVAERGGQEADTGDMGSGSSPTGSSASDAPAFDGDRIERGNEQQADTGDFSTSSRATHDNAALEQFIQGNQEGRA